MRIFALTTALAVSVVMTASAASALTITSSDIKAGRKIAAEQVFNAGGCAGKNISPEISWSGAPKGTKSFAVSIYDPDAPTGSGFWHWWVANIPASVTSLAKGAGDAAGAGLPAGALQVRNDYSTMGYGGPCPPKGIPHHYRVTVFALDLAKLDVDANASPAVVGFNVHFHTLAQATVIGLYGQ